MSRRKGIKQVLAQQQGPQPISPQQPTSSPGQIEVIEFFSYGCPHCYNLDPHLRKWEASLKKDVAFKRVPVSFGRADWASLARIYTTLEAMKLAEKLSPLVFDAIQKDRVRLDDEKTRNDWLAKNSVDVKTFNDTWRSFGVDSLSKRYEQMAVSFKITGVPTLAVNGKFKVDGEGDDTLKTADALIAKERAGK
jgi:thiol:disulfide interchange protein DsbA